MMWTFCRNALLTGAALLLVASGAIGQDSVPPRIAAEDLPLADLQGGRWGVSVKTLDGEPVVEVNAGQRFVPASTLKLVTTAAAFHFLGEPGNAGWPQGTALLLQPDPASSVPDLVLVGSGDPTLSSAPDCRESCLADLADAAAAAGLQEVGEILVDDTLFRTPYWPQGWGHDDLAFGYGTAISALSVDAGVARARISPNQNIGAPPVLAWESPPPFHLDVATASTSDGGFDLELDKAPGSAAGTIEGTIGRNSSTVPLEFGVADPALQAGRVLGRLLRARGIRVQGNVLRQSAADAAGRRGVPASLITRLDTPDAEHMLEEILHESSNFHSEVLLQHLSLTFADPTPKSGLKLMAHLLMEAGAEDYEVALADGSGLSYYNRISPDAMTDLLSFADDQPWYENWASMLASNGGDGTLEWRLTSPALRGRISAKSGTVFGADGLAGYFRARSGKSYVFAIYINDSALNHPAARARIDAMLETLIRKL